LRVDAAADRRQNAKSWELRGAMSLARLRRQQGRPQEAVALLAPIFGWFKEGFAGGRRIRTRGPSAKGKAVGSHSRQALPDLNL
jgi:predicted ATPase